MSMAAVRRWCEVGAPSFETARSLSSGAHPRDPLAPSQDEVYLWVLMVRSREAASRTMKSEAAGITNKKAPVSGGLFALKTVF
jgi:hypothetical protein